MQLTTPQLYTSQRVEIFPEISSGGKYPSVLAIRGADIRVRPDTDFGISRANPKSPTIPLKSLSSKTLCLYIIVIIYKLMLVI